MKQEGQSTGKEGGAGFSIVVGKKYHTRPAYGETLIRLGKANPNVVALDADLACSTKSIKFGNEFPDRFFQMGIAESNMLGTAAGLALGGKIPFVSTFSCFVIGRFEVIKVSIAYSNANVTIVGTHSGVGTGPDGYSQMAQEDLAMMRSLPNMVCIQPADDVETAAATEYLAEHVGPAFLRLTRQAVPRVHPEGTRFRFGRGEILKEGKNVTVVASGATVGHALEAAVDLESTGVSVMVVNMSTVKPIDEELLVHCAKQTGRIMTVEDHSVTGGLGSAVCETLAENRPVPIRRVGLTDFGASGSDEENYRIHGLDAKGIGRGVMAFMADTSSGG